MRSCWDYLIQVRTRSHVVWCMEHHNNFFFFFLQKFKSIRFKIKHFKEYKTILKDERNVDD